MLIRKNGKGEWSLCGFDWDDLPKSVRDDKKLMQTLYGALLKLKDYEAIGLNPDEIDDITYKVLDLMHGCHNCPYEKDCKSIKGSGTCWCKIHYFLFGGKKDGN